MKVNELCALGLFEDIVLSESLHNHHRSYLCSLVVLCFIHYRVNEFEH